MEVDSEFKKKNTNKGCKIAAHFFLNFFLCEIRPYKSLIIKSINLYGIGAMIHIGREMLCLPNAGFLEATL